MATDVRTLVDWLHHDIFELAGPEYAVRRELLDFVMAELQWREERSPRIATLRQALNNQGEQLLGFSRRLDDKLAELPIRRMCHCTGCGSSACYSANPPGETLTGSDGMSSTTSWAISFTSLPMRSLPL